MPTDRKPSGSLGDADGDPDGADGSLGWAALWKVTKVRACCARSQTVPPPTLKVGVYPSGAITCPDCRTRNIKSGGDAHTCDSGWRGQAMRYV